MVRVELHHVFVLSLLCTVSSHEQQPAPRLFPRPMELNLGPMTDTLGIDPCSFACVTLGSGWDAARLTPARWPMPPETAFEIYRPLILRGANCTLVGVHDLEAANPAGQLRELSVMLNISKGASNASTEHYAINVQAGGAALIVSSYIGLVRGLETFSQLVTPADPRVVDAELRIPASVRIRDGPAFQHRGILLDTARNFMPIGSLKQTIDAMAYSKLNVLHVRSHGHPLSRGPLATQSCTLHCCSKRGVVASGLQLHLSDSQSFPLQLTTGRGPEITTHGAYSSAQTYSVADMADLHTYATARGVTLLPEIDTPGHARSFGASPELKDIVACADEYWGSGYCVEPPCGQLNPISELMYTVLADVLADVVAAFPGSPYVHLGFDEVNFKCWTSDPSIAAYLKAYNQSAADILEQFFTRERELLDAAFRQQNTTATAGEDISTQAAMYWDEVVSAGLHTKLRPHDTVQFWHNSASGLLQQYLSATPPTNTAIVSTYSAYYLDCGTGNEFGSPSWCDPYKSWRTIYFSDPLQDVASSDRERIIGGEVALWSEVAGPGSIGAKLWPRASAYGSRLWNYEAGVGADVVEVEMDLGTLAMSMQRRGVASDLIVPEFCLHNQALCFRS